MTVLLLAIGFIIGAAAAVTVAVASHHRRRDSELTETEFPTRRDL